MNTSKPIFILLLMSLLGGCVTPPQPENYQTQINATRLGTDSFMVSSSHQGKDEQIVDLALLRSAELALQNGFSYFIIVKTDSSGTLSTTAESGDTAEYTRHNGLQLQHADPGTTNTIVCFKHRPAGSAFVALLVKASLRAKYGLDQPAAPI